MYTSFNQKETILYLKLTIIGGFNFIVSLPLTSEMSLHRTAHQNSSSKCPLLEHLKH